jgi:hypothetical protein
VFASHQISDRVVAGRQISDPSLEPRAPGLTANAPPRTPPAIPFRGMLDQFSRALLDFERGWWQLPGPKDEMILASLGCSSAEYYRALVTLLDDPEAHRYDPLTVLRLRRMRENALACGATGTGRN